MDFAKNKNTFFSPSKFLEDFSGPNTSLGISHSVWLSLLGRQWGQEMGEGTGWGTVWSRMEVEKENPEWLPALPGATRPSLPHPGDLAAWEQATASVSHTIHHSQSKPHACRISPSTPGSSEASVLRFPFHRYKNWDSDKSCLEEMWVNQPWVKGLDLGTKLRGHQKIQQSRIIF